MLRARETAEAIADAVSAPLQIDQRLAPGTTLERLRIAVADAEGPVAAVCHQPDCSEIALELAGHDPGFPPGGVAELSLDA